MMSFTIVVIIIIMAFLGAPIFVILASLGMVGLYAENISFIAMIADIYNKFANNPLIYTIPIFTFAGYVLAESQASIRIVQLSKALLGWLPGGLAIVSLITCAVFTSFTGASGVTIIALGGLLYPALLKEKYPEKFTMGLLTASGSLGLLFPPSLPVLLYSAVSETSVNQLFAAGLIPGILLIVLLSIFSVTTAQKSHVNKIKFDFKEILKALNLAKWELIIPFLLIVGMFGGFFTLGEIASLIAFYALIVEVFIYKDIKLFQIPAIVTKSMGIVGGILIIMVGAYGFTNYLIDAEIPTIILDSLRGFITSKILFLLILNIFLIIVGCLLDIYSAILVTVPLILPIAKSYGINTVHLGIIFLTNLEIGYLTPPVGMNLFISSYRFNQPVISVYKSSIAFILILLIGLFIITYIPYLSLAPIEIFKIK